MVAKDTVIKPGELGLAIIKYPELPMGQAISIEQAEISFKAGRRAEAKETYDRKLTFNDGRRAGIKEGNEAGIKEVVEWVEENKLGLSSPSDEFFYKYWNKWQAKLEEWGVNS